MDTLSSRIVTAAQQTSCNRPLAHGGEVRMGQRANGESEKEGGVLFRVGRKEIHTVCCLPSFL